MARKSRSKQRSKGAGTRSSKAKSSGKSQGGARSGGKSGATRKAKRAVRRVTRGVGINRMKNRLKNRVVKRKNTRIAQNQGPSTPVKNYGGKAGFMPDLGAGRINNVRLKDKYALPTKLAANNIKNLGITNREKTYFSQKDPSSFGYGTATPKTTTPKSNMDKMRDAARQRHENFKKTIAETGRRVQTFGGTRRNYSYADARALEQAHGGAAGFARVTGGAKNPLAAAPINKNIKMGELMPGVEGFLTKDADKFMSAAPNVNYNFSERDTNLPSMRTLSKADLSGFSKSLGINRDQFKGGKNAFSGSPSDLGYSFRNMFQAKDLGNMTTNAINSMVDKLPFGEKLPNIRPMSMADRDRQTFLGFNPNKPSRNLKANDRGRPKNQQQGTNSYLAPMYATATTAPADESVEEEIIEDPVQPELPDLGGISNEEYESVMEQLTGGTAGGSGSGSGSGSGQPDVKAIADSTGVDASIIERILAGYRGNKRFQFGTGRNQSLMLRRNNQDFLSRLAPFTLSSLNV